MTPDTPTGPVAAAATWRKPIAVVLTILALAALLGAAYFANRAWDAPSPSAQTSAEPGEPTPRESNPDTFRRSEFVLATLTLTMLTLALAAAGLPGLVAVEKPDAEGKLRDARRLLLSAGGLVGLVLMVGGLAFFAYHFGEVTTWLRTLQPPPGAYKPLVALLALVLGAGLAFAAVQPVRAEERDDPLTRRLVYGVNVALTALLLLATLVVVNVIVGLKVPNKIDTTVTGVYSYELNPATRAFVENLETPVKVYAVLSPEGERPESNDARRMLEELRAANPEMVTLEVLSPAINAQRVESLGVRFPEFRALAQRDLGLVVTAGADEGQYAVVPEGDLLDISAGGAGASFVGESKLLRELVFLAEGKVKPVAYVTTGHGELELVEAKSPPGGTAGPTRRPARDARQALDKVYFDVRPLAFDPVKPAVPDDAEVVIVADPRSPLAAGEVQAIVEYTKRAKGGKLLVLAGPTPGPGGAVADAGLAPLMAEYGMNLGDRVLAALPEAGLTAKEHVVIPFQNGGAVANRVATPLVFADCRPISPGTPRDPKLKLVPVLATQDGRITWLEPDANFDPRAAFDAFRRNARLIAEKRLSDSYRVVAASAAEGDAPKVTLFASGESFGDRQRRGGANPNAELVAVAANALRQRPAAADIAAKPYGVYTPNPNTDMVKTAVLPGLVAALGTAALGLGVWMVRRR